MSRRPRSTPADTPPLPTGQGRLRGARRLLVRIGVVLLMLELLLQLAAILPAVGALLSREGAPSIVPDPVLRHRRNPALADYDEAGFRNASRPEVADIVVLGDSQSEGYSVARDHAWPQQLGASLNTSVYNMAVAGYGPAEYRLLADEALALSPRVLIVGLYTGNDLANAWLRVWDDDHCPELKPPLESDPAPRGLPPLDMATTPRGAPDNRNAVVAAFEDHCRLVGLVRAVARLIDPPPALQPDQPDWPWDDLRDEARRQHDPDLLMTLESSVGRTLLTPDFRLRVVDRTDGRIAEGFRLTRNAMRQLRDLGADRGATLLVALIPTKELVLAPFSSASADSALAQLEAIEGRLLADLRLMLEAERIPHVDLVTALRESATAGRFPYRNTDDGHPNVAGNAAIAAALQPAVRALLGAPPE